MAIRVLNASEWEHDHTEQQHRLLRRFSAVAILDAMGGKPDMSGTVRNYAIDVVDGARFRGSELR